MIDPIAIRTSVAAELANQIRALRLTAEWTTPSGRPRHVPMYEIHVQNQYLGHSKVIKGSDEHDVVRKSHGQLERWADQETRRRIADATEDAKDSAAEDTAEAAAKVQALHEILTATLSINDRIDWEAAMDRHTFPEPVPPRPFSFARQPTEPKRRIWEWIIPPLWRKRHEAWNSDVLSWTQARSEAEQAYTREVETVRLSYESQRTAFLSRQRTHNESVASFRRDFESGVPTSLEEYVRAVFERSAYPEGFYREYDVNFDLTSKTIVVDVSLPAQSSITRTVEVRFDARSKQLKGVEMKQKDHDALYDSSVKQCVLRTMHEVFESVYVPHVEAVVVNGWVTAVDEATGNDRTACIVSVGASRQEFIKLNLARIDPTTCIRGLKGLIAGPLSEVAPVKPIMQLNRNDRRFVESREVLDELGRGANLAEVPWEDFEHLVRELFSKMFSTDGAEVRVTQASNDGGVDAVAFDPDPIRGGKFVIQAKRYTKAVPVAAIRDLYGTMINEGASRGLLVTTAHFGREAREFAKDKPISLIDGSNLVYLLEQHGHKVRIDVDEARRKRQELRA